MPLTKGFMINADDADDNIIQNNDELLEDTLQSSMLESDGDVLDPYDRYEEYTAMLVEAGIKIYRFSIDWSMIQSEEGEIDAQTFERFSRILRCCRDHGVEPMVTLIH